MWYAIGNFITTSIIWLFSNNWGKWSNGLYLLFFHSFSCFKEFTTYVPLTMSCFFLFLFKDKTIMATDVESGKLKKCYESAHDEPVYRLLNLDRDKIVTGKLIICLKDRICLFFLWKMILILFLFRWWWRNSEIMGHEKARSRF